MCCVSYTNIIKDFLYLNGSSSTKENMTIQSQHTHIHTTHMQDEEKSFKRQQMKKKIQKYFLSTSVYQSSVVAGCILVHFSSTCHDSKSVEI